MKTDLNNKKIAILGIGTEGVSMIEYLQKFHPSSALTLLDKASAEKIADGLVNSQLAIFKTTLSNPKIFKIFGDQYLEGLEQYDVIFRTPGISFINPKIQEAMKAGVLVTSQLKLFFELCSARIIGVTGTKGKGTTASLIYEIIKESTNLPAVYLAGNIGYPAISLVPKLKSDDIVILELSSFQLMDLEIGPNIAVMTNLEIDHLDYHADLEEYRSAKLNILKYQSEDDWAILNTDSTFSEEVLNTTKGKKKYFSKSKKADCYVRNGAVYLVKNNQEIKICSLDSIQLFGAHNLENIAAATLAADLLEVPYEVIIQVVKEFKGLPHRLEFVGIIGGVKYIDDSFATNPEPTKAAIKSFKENKILILGGSSKGADFAELAQTIKESNVKGVILIGDEGEKIKNALIEAGYEGMVDFGGKTMPEILGSAHKMAKSGDIVLLSPACASFGLFKNYKNRGEQFKTAVLNLISKS